MVVAMRKEIIPFIENSGVKVFNESVGKYQISYFNYLDKEIYIVTCYYYAFSVNGALQYRRSQRYYSISEPWKIYSRFGLYNTSTKKTNWNAWHVVEGVEE